MSPLGHVCLGLVLDTMAPAGGEPEILSGCKQRALGMGWFVGMKAALSSEWPGPSFRSCGPDTGALFIPEACGPPLCWLFLLDGHLARHDAKDRDVRKKVDSAK